MWHIFQRRVFMFILGFIFLFPSVLNSQSYRFKNYSTDSKIPNGFIYTIDQTSDGFLWVGTASGICRFDGFNFFNVSFPDSATGRYPSTSLKDSNGTIWYGCNDGSLFCTDGNDLKNVKLVNAKSISDLVEGPDGLIYIIPQGKYIFSINPVNTDDVHSYKIDPSLVILSACFSQSGKLLLGTQEDIKILSVSNDTISQTGSVDGFDYSAIHSIKRMNDTDMFLIGTDGSGLYKLFLSPAGNVLSRFAGHPELETLRVQSIMEDKEKDFWVSTYESGVFQISISDTGESLLSVKSFNKSSGLSTDDIQIVFQDIEENYWIGLFGNGLSLLNSYSFCFFAPGLTPEKNNIISINKINSDYFLGTPSGYYLFDLYDFKIKSFVDLKKGTGNNEIISYYIDNEKNIWIGTAGGGLFVKNHLGAMKQYFRSSDSGENYINNILTDDNRVWLGTLMGVIVLDKKSARVEKKFNLNSGGPFNFVNHLFVTSEGNIAVGGKSDKTYLIRPDLNEFSYQASMSGPTLNDIKSFTQDKQGVLWAATSGNGIFACYPDSVRSFSKSEMLMSDYCYSIMTDSDNKIWIGHEGGFSKFDPRTGIVKVFGIDYTKGGVCNNDGMFEDDGRFFIGTTNGIVIYDRAKEKKTQLAPFNNINYVIINDVEHPYKSSFTLPYSKRYNIKVGYTGINLSNPEKVFYSTMLENYDEGWSKLTLNREITYAPGDGSYVFNMISVNEDGLSQESPVTFMLTIKKPIWRMPWFVLLSIALAIGIVILVIKEREKSHIKIQEYLERELQARTSVVLKQKGEIELQNIEITDSINYAKRIQTSILPDFHRLQLAVNDAFLLFRPRDIVSGDFYWFEKIDDDKFVVVCADSTGHGVPGAFMSMIGATLLQDIVARQRISKPSEILSRLDHQIFSTINQNVELGVSNDGMDVVVCEIDIKSRHLVFASAMRPVILLIDGEPAYIKGNRSSVGGESVIEKYFDDQEYFLNEGDTLYLFSDGLPDQFGGVEGKKMKIARLKKLIESISSLSMNEQKEAINSFYDEWKGDYEQVDDIMMIGIKF